MIKREIFFLESLHVLDMKSRRILEFLLNNSKYAFTLDDISENIGLTKSQVSDSGKILKNNDFIYRTKVHGKTYYLFKELNILRGRD